MSQSKNYDSLEKIQVSSEWFEVYKLRNNVIAIYEPYHFQEVISYLIIGSEKSLLIDTGMGVANIKSIVKELTDTPVIVINSHIHFDHVGNNSLFNEVLVFNSKEAIQRLKKGYSIDELKPHSQIELFEKNPPIEFDIESYVIPPCNPVPVNNRDIIDLGNRKIEIIHTPGHSKESIMLLDRKNRILFTGDSYYPGPLYAHFNGSFYGSSDISTYATSLKKISKLVPELDFIHPSHNFPIIEPLILKKVADALALLSAGTVQPGKLLKENLSIASLPANGENVKGYIIPNNLYIYEFDGFSIIARKCHI